MVDNSSISKSALLGGGDDTVPEAVAYLFKGKPVVVSKRTPDHVVRAAKQTAHGEVDDLDKDDLLLIEAVWAEQFVFSASNPELSNRTAVEVGGITAFFPNGSIPSAQLERNHEGH